MISRKESLPEENKSKTSPYFLSLFFPIFRSLGANSVGNVLKKRFCLPAEYLSTNSWSICKTKKY